MNTLSLILVILGFSGAAFGAAGAESCINNANPNNRKLIEAFYANQDSLKKAFQNEKARIERTKKPACASDDLVQQQLNNLKAIADKTQDNDMGIKPGDAVDFEDVGKDPAKIPALIKRECIAASLKRSPGQNGYTCSYPNKKDAGQDVEKSYGQVGGKTLQCVNNEMVDYVQFAVNRAIKCLSPDIPVDSRVIYQKFNNETGFNFSIAWNGGVGIGQLTTPAVKELASDEGNGKYVLEAVANSNKQSCEGFKEIAQEDLKNRPRINAGNYCSFVNSGDGLARNLIYGIGYYLRMRDDFIIPDLLAYNKSFAGNREIVSALTAVSYGAEGIKKAKALASKADQYKKSTKSCAEPAKCYLAMIQSQSVYLKAIKGKMGEMYCLKDNVDPASANCTSKKSQLTPSQLGANECVK